MDKNGNGPLFSAAGQSDPTVVDLLLKAGAKIDQENRQGMTPLMEAARTGQLDVLQRLIKAGAQLDRLDFTGRGALDWARDGRNPRVTAALQQAGAR